MVGSSSVVKTWLRQDFDMGPDDMKKPPAGGLARGQNQHDQANRSGHGVVALWAHVPGVYRICAMVMLENPARNP
jgi:hypothetical protein